MKRHRRRRSPERRRARSFFRTPSSTRRAAQRRLGQIEALEDRRVLEANPLATFEAQLDNAAKMPELRLNVDAGGTSNFIGLHVASTGGTLDPGEIVIQNSNGDSISPTISLADVNGSTDSYLLVRLADGEFPVILSNDGGTGSFRVNAFLPGDLDNGVVSEQEYITASSSLIQDFETNVNHISQLFFRQRNINLLQNQYHKAFDANMNGRIDPFDLERIEFNMDHPPVLLSFDGELNPPAITLDMTNDTGSPEIDGSFDDGITNFNGIVDEDVDGFDDDGVLDPIFTGTLMDASEVESFRMSIDSTNLFDFIDVSDLLDPALNDPDSGTDAVFSLTLDDLDRILNRDGAGTETVENSGSHTLRIIAGDELSNSLGLGSADDAPPFEFTFEIDTDRPVPPTALDLSFLSDTGSADDDDITQDTTPTIRVTLEESQEGQLVQLMSTLAPSQVIGSGIVGADGTVLITSSELVDGDHQLSATTTNVAGTESFVSSPLGVTIDTELTQLSLTTTIVTGLLGDLEGVTDPNAEVSLTRDDGGEIPIPVMADGNGNFVFQNLSFPSSTAPVNFILTATDPAGNTRVSDPQTVERNQAPELNVPLSDVSVNEDAAPMTGIDLSNLFTDPDGGTFTFSAVSGNTSLVQTNINGSTLDLTFQPDAFGETTVTITGTDSGGASIDSTFGIDITGINDVPSFTIGDNQTVNEDNDGNGPVTVSGFATSISAGGPVNPSFESTQTLDFIVTSDNPSLFDGPIDINSTSGDLTFTLAANANGAANVMVQLMDNGGTDDGGIDLSGTQSFTITVNEVNDAPGFNLLNNPALTEIDEGTIDLQTVPGFAFGITTGGGSDESSQTLTFDLSVDDEGLFSTMPAIDATTGDLTYQIANADTSGMIEVTVTLMDNGGTANGGMDTSPSQMFTINIIDINDPPTAMDDDLSVTLGIPNTLNVRDNDTIAPDVGETLTITDVTAASNGTVEVSSDGLTLLYTPGEFPAGTTDTFTYTIDDGRGGTDTADVTVDFVIGTVVAVDDSFGLNGSVILEDSDSVELDVLTNDDDPDDPGSGGFIITGVTQGSNGGQVGFTDTMVNYEPADDFFGTETFMYTIEETGGAMDTATVTIEVTPVNDAPSFSIPASPDQQILEGTTSLQTVGGFAFGFDAGGGSFESGSGQAIDAYVVTTNNNSLFSMLPAINASTGDLTYQIAGEDTVGLAEVTVRLRDDGGTDNGGVDLSSPQMFMIEVTQVNDAPSFTVGPNQSVDDDAPPQTVVGHATNIMPGPIDENGQTLTFMVTTSNDSLFDVLPAIDASGTLTYDPAAGTSGTAEVTVVLMDDGGTANGGDDTSDPQMFNISINDENAAPTVANPIADLNLNDVDPNNPPNAGPQPGIINLDNVFDDPDNDLTYEVVSNTNSDLVSTSVNGNMLTVNYLSYLSEQDRTPATIIVRATEVGGAGLTVDDTFVVSVDPEKTFEIHLVALNAPSAPQPPNFDFQVDQLPTSIDSVPIGQSYVVEVYLRDLLVPDIIAGTDFSTSISGAFIDLTFEDSLVDTVSPDDWMDIGEFSQAAGTPPIVGADIIERIGGFQTDTGAGFGLAPQFIRLGYLEITADQTGQQNYAIHLDADGQTTGAGRFGVDGVIGDDIDNNQIDLFNVSVVHTSEIVTLNIDAGQSEIEVGGMFGASALSPQLQNSSNSPELSGTIRVEVDDLDNPDLFRILDANVDWETTGEWKPNNQDPPDVFDPNQGETEDVSFDPANIGLVNTQNVLGTDFDLWWAGRDFGSNISSDWINLGPGGMFDASEWNWTMTTGELDQHLGENGEDQIGGAEDSIAGEDIVPNNTPGASLVRDNGTLTLTLPVAHHLNADVTGGPIQLDFDNGSIVATFNVPGSASASASAAPSNSAPLLLEDEMLGNETVSATASIAPAMLASTAAGVVPSSAELSAALEKNGLSVEGAELLTTIVPTGEIVPAYFGQIGTLTSDETADDEAPTTTLEEQLTSVDAIFSDWNDPLI